MDARHKKRRDIKNQSLYSRCLLTRKAVVAVTCVGKNLDEVLEEYIRDHFEGKCVVEGFVKPNSCKLIRYSSGKIVRGSNVVFDVVFECDVCFLVEGMNVTCRVDKINKAGIHASSATEVPSPILVFLAKDHHFASHQYNDIQLGDTITVRVIGQRFELNDKALSIIGELVKESKHYNAPPQRMPANKPKLVIEEE